MANNYDAFDEQQASVTYGKPKKELWEIDIFNKASEGELIQWLMGEKNYLIEENRARMRTVETNLAQYKGIQYQSQYINDYNSSEKGSDRSQILQKIVCNHIYDLVQQKVSRLIKYRPALAILPTANELEDRVGAKMSKLLLDNIWYEQNFEGEVQNEFVKTVHVMGEAYLAVLWDKNAGPIHKDIRPKLDELKKNGEFVLTQEDGSPELDENGEPIKIKNVIHYGDTVYQIWYTLDTLLDKKSQWKEVDHLFHKETISKAEAKQKYGYGETKEFAEDAFMYDYEKMVTRKLANECMLWTFYHRKTEMLPTGAEIKFIGDRVVSVKELDSSSGKLPVERLTDVDMPGELHGVSFIQVIKGLTGTYNNITNMIVRNQVLVSHPKWMYAQGSINVDALGNDITNVSVKGPIMPQLVQTNPTPRELFEFRGLLKEEFQQISGVFGVSRGEPPPGIKAGIALQFLAEQENERMNEMVLKYNDWVRRIGIKTIERCADNYQPDDERMMMILGKNNKWMSTFFDVKYLSKQYDIRVQNSSALPQSKAARTQYLLDLNEKFPAQITPEQVLDQLDLAQPDKFVDIATVSVKAAEAENESIMEGTAELHDPKEYEDHIIHWITHVKQVREWSFKNQSPKELQEKMEAHILAHEMLMVKKLMTNPNPLYQEMVATRCPGFPLFFTIPTPPPMDPAMAQGVPPAAMQGAEESQYVEEGLDVNTPPMGLQAQMGADGANIDVNEQGLPPIQPTSQA